MLDAKTTRRQRTSIRDLIKQVRRGAAQLNKACAETQLEEAERLVPVKSGALKNTLRVEVDERTGTAHMIAGDDEVTYAAPVEWGSALRNTPAQPFMTPAAEKAKRDRAGIARKMKVFK